MGKIVQPIVSYINEPIIDIKNVFYGGKNREYELFLTPTENSMNLEETCEWSAQQREKGNPFVPSSKEIGLFLNSIANSGNEKVIREVQKMLRANLWIGTTSAIDYFPSGNTRVYHNLDLDEAHYNVCKNVFGDDGEISTTPNTSSLVKGVYGLEIDEMKRVGETINKTPVYLWRENSTLNKKIRKRVELDAYSVRLDLGCLRHPLDSDPAFRVLQKN